MCVSICLFKDISACRRVSVSAYVNVLGFDIFELAFCAFHNDLPERREGGGGRGVSLYSPSFWPYVYFESSK
jgi:hypothetical protein